MISFPNAKINLGLHIINKRDDGFHNIESVFYPVPLCDMLEVIEMKRGGKKWKFETHGLVVGASDSDNLVIRAYQLLDELCNLPPVEICLYKKIPMGAGLGGGSADAAFMLKLLNEKFGLGFDREKLKNLASQLGSDCPFFIDNKPAYLYGRGHELQHFPVSLNGLYLVLLYPGVHSNTALAYNQAKPRGEQDESKSIKNSFQWPVSTWKNTLQNDFEHSVFMAYPELADLKEQLYVNGALYASMSGSGSGIFGLFEAKPQLPEKWYNMIVYEGMLN